MFIIDISLIIYFLQKLSKLKPDTILEILCEFLMQPECTKDVIDCFPELLLGIISVAIPIEDIQSSALIDKNIIHRLNCVILGKLLDVNQDLLMYVYSKIYYTNKYVLCCT